MSRSSPANGRMHRLGGTSLARLIRLVSRTSRLIVEPTDGLDRIRAEHPAIFTCWHGQFMMVPAVSPQGMPLSVMVARHGDAEFLSVAIAEFGHGLIRGAGAGSRPRDRGGVAALRGALAALEGGRSVAMTSDVPPGPARVAGLGIITLARLSGRPIVPTGFATSRALVLNTWSRFTVNLPYSRLAVVVGSPIHVPRDLDESGLEQKRAALEQALGAAMRRAHEIAGRPVPPIPTVPPPAEGMAAAVRAPPPSRGLQLYRAMTRGAGPIARAVLAVRARQGKEDPARRGERLGEASLPRPEGALAWVHAASVGEMNAVLPLISALKADRPDLSVLLTTGTRTSAEIAGRRLPPGTQHQFVPVDVPAFVRRFLDHWRPEVAVFTESDLWPNLISQSADRGIRLALINARMSDRSFQRWRRRPAMAAALLGRFDVVLAQNEKLARRFRDLGAHAAINAGNLKIDAPPPPVDPEKRQLLEARLGARPRLLGASTHAGEEEILASAHIEAARDVAGLTTIIAPRHPARGPEIARALSALGLKTGLRSQGALPDAGVDIYIADTIGELGTLYAVSPIAFVGGSLVEHGGQNPIEAIRHGSVVLTGPHVENFRDTFQPLLRQQAAIEVRSAAELAAVLRRLFTDEGEIERMRRRADDVLAGMSGALPRTLAAIQPLLSPRPVELVRAT